MSKVIVTGANGFLGLTIVRRLLEMNENVLAFLKRGEDAASLSSLGVPFVFGDVTEKGCIEYFINEGDEIIHAAAIVSITKRDRELVWKVNCEGTKNVLDSALSKKARALIYVSSVHTIPLRDGPIEEADFYEPGGSSLGPYEESKREATKLVLAANGHGISTTVIFPSGIMGPGDEKMGEITTLVTMILRKRLPFYVSGGYAFCDVRDVAEAVCRSLSLGGDSYIVSSGYLSIRQIVDFVQEKAGIRAISLQVPRFLAWLALPIASFFQLFSRSKPLYTSYSLRVTKGHPGFKSGKAEDKLGVKLRAPRESLGDEVAYLLAKRIK